MKSFNPFKIINALLFNQVLVLMYHRIAELNSDPWELAVSPDNFERHLRILTTKYKVISISELIASLKRKSLPSKTVCITFDDGYGDNYFVAKPLLEKYRCPATFFISTKYIEQQKMFWWDELEEIILGSEILPKDLSIFINEECFEFELQDDVTLTNKQRELHNKWVWTEQPPTRRCELYFALWERIKPLRFNEQQSIIKDLKQWGNYNYFNDKNLPMTIQQLNDMSNHRLFEIGLHTASHPFMSLHSTEFQTQEISDNEIFLNESCPNFSRVIAYPFGNYNEETVAVVKKLGLNAAFTTGETIVNRNSDLFKIGRFPVTNWNEQKFDNQISQWFKAL